MAEFCHGAFTTSLVEHRGRLDGMYTYAAGKRQQRRGSLLGKASHKAPFLDLERYDEASC